MYYDPTTIEMLAGTLASASDLLAPEQRACLSRLDMAKQMFKAAAKGERDLARRRAIATLQVVSAEESTGPEGPLTRKLSWSI
jgi:hypothetical protein